MIDDSLAPLQAALESTADLTYDQARSMPGAFYTDPRLLALEREQLFMREWICVGRREEVAAPGDYMAVRICDEPVIVVHGRDGVIRALSNVCRHFRRAVESRVGKEHRIGCRSR
jgi:phenylpropionate dioxygenase-like ring-hydroxylating dioxygenase large terminal subunit